MNDGTLAGIRVVEMAGLAPGPFAAMMLADHGAEVIRIDRPTPTVADPDLLGRNRDTLNVNLKDPDVRAGVLELIDHADVLIEGFRPGTMERLGLGPEVCRGRNPRLVYGRMTGWGQEGARSRAAGHDLNYLALSGALGAVGPAGQAPVPPINFVADFGAGGMMLAFAVVAALVERTRSGQGQVIDAAMVDGAALFTTHLHSMLADGTWEGERGENLLDGGAPYYRCYATSDGGFMSVGAIETPFWDELLERLDLGAGDLPDREDRSQWAALAGRLASVFATRTRQEWSAVFAGTDACVEAVLTPQEAARSAENAERGVFVEIDHHVQPAPAPRFARTPAPKPRPATPAAEASLAGWGLSHDHVRALTGGMLDDAPPGGDQRAR